MGGEECSGCSPVKRFALLRYAPPGSPKHPLRGGKTFIRSRRGSAAPRPAGRRRPCAAAGLKRPARTETEELGHSAATAMPVPAAVAAAPAKPRAKRAAGCCSGGLTTHSQEPWPQGQAGGWRFGSRLLTNRNLIVQLTHLAFSRDSVPSPVPVPVTAMPEHGAMPRPAIGRPMTQSGRWRSQMRQWTIRNRKGHLQGSVDSLASVLLRRGRSY